MKVALFNHGFPEACFKQVTTGPTTGNDLSFSATCLSLYHTPTSLKTLVLTACHFSTTMRCTWPLGLRFFSLQTGGQHASSTISWADNEIINAHGFEEQERESGRAG